MNVFTLDIGKGTQDFLLYVDGENIRNCPKSVFPSPTRIVAEKIRKLAESNEDILLTGYTMGGGPSSKAIIDAAKKVRVYSYQKPALTINDNLEIVEKYGIKIVKEDFIKENNNKKIKKVELKDVDLKFYENILSDLHFELPDTLIIAVQDHGFSPKESNRKFRFKLFEKTLKKSPYLENFLFKDVPPHYNRMTSVVESIRDFGESINREFDVYLIDTVFAAVAGAMLDAKEFPALVINFGNGHTIAAIVDRDRRIYSLMEHHTSIIRKIDFDRLIQRFIKGEITNEEIFNQGGHGAYIGEVVDVRDVVATGPNILSGFREANPVGDVMIVGNLGMLELLKCYESLGGI